MQEKEATHTVKSVLAVAGWIVTRRVAYLDAELRATYIWLCQRQSFAVRGRGPTHETAGSGHDSVPHMTRRDEDVLGPFNHLERAVAA